MAAPENRTRRCDRARVAADHCPARCRLAVRACRRDHAGWPGVSRVFHGGLRLAPRGGDRAGQRRADAASIRISPATCCITTGCRTCSAACSIDLPAAWASLDELLLIRSIAIDLFFVAFLYGMVRLFRVRPWAAATRRGVRHPLDQFRRALCPVRLLVEERPNQRGEGTSTSTRSAAGISRAFRSMACSACSSISRITSSATRSA